MVKILYLPKWKHCRVFLFFIFIFLSTRTTASKATSDDDKINNNTTGKTSKLYSILWFITDNFEFQYLHKKELTRGYVYYGISNGLCLFSFLLSQNNVRLGLFNLHFNVIRWVTTSIRYYKDMYYDKLVKKGIGKFMKSLYYSALFYNLLMSFCLISVEIYKCINIRMLSIVNLIAYILDKKHKSENTNTIYNQLNETYYCYIHFCRQYQNDKNIRTPFPNRHVNVDKRYKVCSNTSPLYLILFIKIEIDIKTLIELIYHIKQRFNIGLFHNKQ